MGNNNTLSGRRNDGVVEIDLGSLFMVLFHQLPAILLGALVCGLITLAVNAFVIKPTYRSSFTAYVNNHSSSDMASSLSSGDTSAAQSLAYTYSAIMCNRSVLQDAAEQAGLDYGYDELKNFVSVEVESSTQLVNLYVTMNDPEEAYQFAKAIEETAPSYIEDIVEGSSMKIVAEAELPTKRYSPRVKRNTVIGCIIGLLIMIVFFTINELRDTRVKSEDDLEERFGIPVIGTIPDFDAAASGKTYSKYYGGKYTNS